MHPCTNTTRVYLSNVVITNKQCLWPNLLPHFSKHKALHWRHMRALSNRNHFVEWRHWIVDLFQVEWSPFGPFWLQMNISLDTYVVTDICKLTHLPCDKMAAISQTIFSDAISWMKCFVVLIKISLKFVPKGAIRSSDNESTSFWPPGGGWGWFN